MATLLSVNVATARRLKVNDRHVLSAFEKRSVGGVVAVGPMGLAGDEQADPTYHGGLDKAVYAYPHEHYAFWQQRRAAQQAHQPALAGLEETALPYGFVGENLSISGLLETEVWLGDELHFANCVLRVTSPRDPCGKFNAVMGYNQAGKDMATKGCSGFYLAVDQPGTVQAGEAFTLVAGQRAVSVAEAFAAKFAKHRI
jgi:MOSC domain-containing protein YiiM